MLVETQELIAKHEEVAALIPRLKEMQGLHTEAQSRIANLEQEMREMTDKAHGIYERVDPRLKIA